MPLNDEILDAEIRHSVYLQRYTGGVNKRILALLMKTEDDVMAKIRKVGGITSFQSKRLTTLLESIRAIRKEAYKSAGQALYNEAIDLSKYEAGFQTTLLEKTMPIQWNVIVPSSELLRAATVSKPFQGRLLRDWVKSLESRELALMKDQITMGVIEGETTEQIMRRIRGTKALNYADGVFGKSQRDVQAVVRTAVSHIHNAARAEVGKLNSEFIKKVQWVSTLDGRTSPICRARDNKLYPLNSGPRPPAHFRCRSTITFVTKSWKELGIDLQEAPTGTRASMNGQVPADLSYNDWLRTQDRSFIDETLGVNKAKLYMDGKLPLSKFVDVRGNELTLDALRVKESTAWDAAGL